MPNSPKKERRRERLAAAREEEIRRALSTPRRLSERIPGSGFRIVQVALLPSFDHARCFEICEASSFDGALDSEAWPSVGPRNLTLRVSAGERPGSKHVVGHQIVAAPPLALVEFLRRLAATPIVVVPAAPTYGTADGIRIHVAICTGEAEATFRWVQGHVPSQWLELDRLAREFLSECDVWLGTV